MPNTDPRTIPEVISDISQDLSNLVRRESELVRTEVAEKAEQLTAAGKEFSAGGALLLGGFLALLQTVVLALAWIMPMVWASLIVAVVASLIGYTLVKNASSKVKPANLAPERSAREARKTADYVKGQVQ